MEQSRVTSSGTTTELLLLAASGVRQLTGTCRTSSQSYNSLSSLVKSAVNMTLPALAAERCAAAPLLLGAGARRCRSICPTCGALSSKSTTRRCCYRPMGQTDRRTDATLLCIPSRQ